MPEETGIYKDNEIEGTFILTVKSVETRLNNLVAYWK